MRGGLGPHVTSDLFWLFKVLSKIDSKTEFRILKKSKKSEEKSKNSTGPAPASD